MNQCNFMGRLVRDPEYNSTNSGTGVCRICIAVDFGYGENKGTSFLNCVFFGKRAEVVRDYFQKGSRILITNAECRQSSYTDKEGNKKTSFDFVGGDLSFVDGKGGKSIEEGTKPTLTEPTANVDGFVNIPDGIGEEKLPWD